MSSAPASDRLGTLDALRGLAAMAVVLFHYIHWYDHLYGHDFTPWAPIEAGRYGVHLFFMLSGFVIFMTLERTATPRLFALARAFRLLPALWAGILLTFFAVHWLGPQDRAVGPGTALINTTLLHEYLGFEHVDGAYWSLVIEATFYVWIALLYYAVGDWARIRALLWVWVLISYVSVLLWQQIPDGLAFLLKDLLFTRYAPLFISGMLIYRWYRHGRPDPGEQALLALAVGHSLLSYKAPFNLVVFAGYAVFMLAITGRLEGLCRAPLLWLGRLSYSLYLVHQNIGYGIISTAYTAGLPGWIGILLALISAITLAILIHRLIEQPALGWFRRRLRPHAGAQPIGRS
jgi:peptidoglycan/LPS O-acetylase OafA/YrhL